MKSVSLIVTCDEEQQIPLRRLLPELLSMVYGGKFEVIVVDKVHDKDTEEWLEDMEANEPILNHTFCSPTARGIDIQKLALTLGAKAANYDWLAILPQPSSLLDALAQRRTPKVRNNPQPSDWLRELLSHIDEEMDVVVGILDCKRRWSWLKSYLFRRRFSIYRPTSSIILCRRSTLLQGKPIKLSKHQIFPLISNS